MVNKAVLCAGYSSCELVGGKRAQWDCVTQHREQVLVEFCSAKFFYSVHLQSCLTGVNEQSSSTYEVQQHQSMHSSLHEHTSEVTCSRKHEPTP